MEPNTESGTPATDIWIRANATLSAWEKQQAAREFQREYDRAARVEAALWEIRAAREARRQERREQWIAWTATFLTAAALTYRFCAWGCP